MRPPASFSTGARTWHLSCTQVLMWLSVGSFFGHLIARRPAVPRAGEKKLVALRCKLEYRAGEDRTVYGAQHLRSIAWSWVTSATLVSPFWADIPFERLSTTTYPHRRGI